MDAKSDNRSIAKLAARQHGVVARRQLLALGVTRDVIAGAVARGWLHRVHTGVYAVGHAALTREGRWLSATLALGPGAVLSHRAAAALWAILPWSPLLEITVPTGRASRAGIVVHRARIEPGELTVRHGIPTTTLPRTLLDLAAVVDARTLANAFEEAQVQHRLRPAVLAAALANSPGRRGATRLRALLADAVEPGQVESVLDLRLPGAVRHPRPAAAADASAARSCRVDFWFPSLRVAVETDGARFHATAAKRARDARKDAALEAVGVRVLRLRWADVTRDPMGTAVAVRAAARQGSIAKRSSPSPRTKSSEAVTR
jgi:hypothetical protein